MRFGVKTHKPLFYSNIYNRRILRKRLTLTLPRLGSRVRIPSPAPVFKGLARPCSNIFKNLVYTDHIRICDLECEFWKIRVSMFPHQSLMIHSRPRFLEKRTSFPLGPLRTAESISSFEEIIRNPFGCVGLGFPVCRDISTVLPELLTNILHIVLLKNSTISSW